MLDSIYIGMTGLLGYSKGLRVIANNTSNINTPGYKGSSLQFADLFYSNSNLAGGTGGQSYGQLGYGLDTKGTALSFKQGELRSTSNDLDAAVDGTGLFVLKNGDGEISYTRAGQFEFNSAGILVTKSDGSKVMALDSNKNLIEISQADLKTIAGRATAKIKFAGNLSSTTSPQTISGVKVIDAAGTEHTLSLTMTNAAGTWTVTVLDGAKEVGTGSIVFAGTSPAPGSSTVAFNYTPVGVSTIALTLDFSTDVTAFAGATTLAMASQDGLVPGALLTTTFNADGSLNLSYSNGQTLKGAKLALARFDSVNAVETVGNNQFRALDPTQWHLGVAGTDTFGSVKAKEVEISNVDLAQEFSDLVVMQRGYQSSSQVITTANEMLQQLFSMKSK
jgi:flagellar hook protein FlgE